MRDIDEGDADFALNALQLNAHLLAQLQVERAERLIKQKHCGAIHQCTRKGDALRLSARELRRLALLVADQLYEFERFANATRDLVTLDARTTKAEGNVFKDGEMREERVALEDGVDVALVGGEEGDVFTLQLNEAARRLLEAADHAQGCGLAAAGWAEEGEELAVGDIKRDAVHRGLISEHLGHVDQANVDVSHPRLHLRGHLSFSCPSNEDVRRL